MVNSKTKPVDVRRHLIIIDIFRKAIRHPFFRTIPFGKIKLAERVAPIGIFFPGNYWIVSPDPDRLVVMREGESAYPLVDLLLASYRPEEFDNSSDRDGHAMSILTIGDV